jgi:AraC-like DNA-binding protein
VRYDDPRRSLEDPANHQNLEAASAGYRVGYDDASQFNREYKRLFG